MIFVRGLCSISVLSGAVLLALGGPAHAQSADGARVFANKCQSCHFDPAKVGDQPRLGPSLRNVVGRKAGSLPGYIRYSPAMKAFNRTWDPDLVKLFLAAPRKLVPGTTMSFPGLANPAERDALVRYLQGASSK